MSADRGMGRGLAAILSAVPETARRAELRDLAVELIAPNPAQPRKRFDDDALASLAESVRECGVLQPVLVRPLVGGTYELVAGERRWRAARIAGLKRIPALVQERDDATSLELALVENVAREDLNPVEEARAVAALVDELGLTREQVGIRIGRSRVAVSNLVRILDLPDDVLNLLEIGRLTEGHGRALLLAADHADRRRLAHTAAQEGWSVRTTEQRAREAGAASRSVITAGAAVHPDQQAATAEIAERLGQALGSEVVVRPRGDGFLAELSFASVDAALLFADRLATRAG